MEFRQLADENQSVIINLKQTTAHHIFWNTPIFNQNESLVPVKFKSEARKMGNNKKK